MMLPRDRRRRVPRRTRLFAGCVLAGALVACADDPDNEAVNEPGSVEAVDEPADRDPEPPPADPGDELDERDPEPPPDQNLDDAYPIDGEGMLVTVQCRQSLLSISFLRPSDLEPQYWFDVDTTGLQTYACGNTAFNQSPVSRQAFSRDMRYFAASETGDDGGEHVVVVDVFTGIRTNVSASREDGGFNAPLHADRFPAFEPHTDTLLFDDANTEQMYAARAEDGWEPQPWDGERHVNQGFLVVPGAGVVLPRDDRSTRTYLPHPGGGPVLEATSSGYTLLDPAAGAGVPPRDWEGAQLGDPGCIARSWLGADRILCVMPSAGIGSTGDLAYVEPTDGCTSHELTRLTEAPDRRNLTAIPSPSGDQILLVSARGEQTGVYLVHTDGGEPTELRATGGEDLRFAAWVSSEDRPTGTTC